MPGVIRMGDVNGDGQIDGEDMEELIDAITRQRVTPRIPGAILTGTGKLISLISSTLRFFIK